MLGLFIKKGACLLPCIFDMIRLNNNTVAIFRYLQLLTPYTQTNSIYITHIWEERMPRRIVCKAITTNRLCWNCGEKQAWYEASRGKKKGSAGI